RSATVATPPAPAAPPRVGAVTMCSAQAPLAAADGSVLGEAPRALLVSDRARIGLFSLRGADEVKGVGAASEPVHAAALRRDGEAAILVTLRGHTLAIAELTGGPRIVAADAGGARLAHCCFADGDTFYASDRNAVVEARVDWSDAGSSAAVTLIARR